MYRPVHMFVFLACTTLAHSIFPMSAFADYKGCKKAREWYVMQSERCRTDPTVDQEICAGLADLAKDLAYSACPQDQKKRIRKEVLSGPGDREPVGKDAKARTQGGAKTPGLDQFDGLGPNYVSQGTGSTGVRGASGSTPTARASSTQTPKTFSPGVQGTVVQQNGGAQQTFKTFSPGVMDTTGSQLK